MRGRQSASALAGGRIAPSARNEEGGESRMGTLSQDIRYALRQLKKSPGFALTAIITLGLGIGINAAMFSVIEQVILRPLPYPNAARMVAIDEHDPHSANSTSISLPNLRDYQVRSHTLQALGYYTMQLPTLGGTENPQLVPQMMISASLLQVLGVHPAMGRGFTAEDNTPGHNQILILSDSVWRSSTMPIQGSSAARFPSTAILTPWSASCRWTCPSPWAQRTRS